MSMLRGRGWGSFKLSRTLGRVGMAESLVVSLY